MTSPSTPQRIAIDSAGAPTDLVSRVVSAIRDGQRVALPTETVYGLAADPTDDAAIGRLRAEKGRGPDHHFTVHLAGPEQLEALDVDVPTNARRLMARYWPGPLTLVLPRRGGGTVGVRVPAHDFTRAVIGSFPTGLYLTSINKTGEPPLQTPDEIADSGHVDLLLDAGTPRLGLSSCVVQLGPEGLRVLREGVLTEGELLRSAAAEILFVCSGNTCRSPMAEVIAKDALSRSLDVSVDRLLPRGVSVRSAGTGAMLDSPASENAIAALAERGLDGTSHRSTPLDHDSVQRADLILCMGRSHLGAISAALGIPDPAALAPRIQLLDPTGRDVADPFGGDVDVYRAARDQIAKSIEARLPSLVDLVRSD